MGKRVYFAVEGGSKITFDDSKKAGCVSSGHHELLLTIHCGYGPWMTHLKQHMRLAISVLSEI